MTLFKTLTAACLIGLIFLCSACTGCNEREAKATLPAMEKKTEKGGKNDSQGASSTPSSSAASTPSTDSGTLAAQLFTGTTEAHRKSTIAPPFSATVKKVHVREGDYVKKGQILVKLDTKDIALQKKQARAALDAAQANYEVTLLDWERMKALYESAGIPKSQFDMIDAKLKATRAGVDQARVALDTCKKHMGDASVRAPYSGLIVKKLVSEGERATTMPPTPLVVIEEIDILDLRIKVPETEMKRFTEGSKITIYFSAIDKSVTATISQVVESIDPMTRTFAVIAEIENGDHALRPGMFAEVKLDRSGPDKAEGAKE